MFAGPIVNDFSSVGYSLLLNKEKAIIVQPDRVVIGNGPAFGYEFQMQYGSIGWSVGATLGYAQASVTAQDVSTMLRCGQRTIIFLINNGPLEEELIEAIKTATNAKKDCLCFIEVFAHKDDTSKALLEWGSRVSAANSRPPNPQ
ncbi:unnamed protein product [Ilex paraguariensis]|uniref:pyruvate decarboxylase n=1 Tax=Ilex paraguariensis TaxID=185542 RepID=A0ABC8RAK8_9AQUA